MSVAHSTPPAPRIVIPAIAAWPEGFSVWNRRTKGVSVSRLAWEGFCQSTYATGHAHHQTNAEAFMHMLVKAFLGARHSSEYPKLGVPPESLVNDQFYLQFNLGDSRDQHLYSIVIPEPWQNRDVRRRLADLHPQVQ